MEPVLRVLSDRHYDAKLLTYFPTPEGRPWYWRHLGLKPRAFALGGTIYVRRGHEANVRLVAHELGHVRGLKHPPVLSLSYWTDIMGYGLRLFDRYDLLPAAERLVGARGQPS